MYKDDNDPWYIKAFAFIIIVLIVAGIILLDVIFKTEILHQPARCAFTHCVTVLQVIQK